MRSLEGQGKAFNRNLTEASTSRNREPPKTSEIPKPKKPKQRNQVLDAETRIQAWIQHGNVSGLGARVGV